MSLKFYDKQPHVYPVIICFISENTHGLFRFTTLQRDKRAVIEKESLKSQRKPGTKQSQISLLDASLCLCLEVGWGGVRVGAGSQSKTFLPALFQVPSLFSPNLGLAAAMT